VQLELDVLIVLQVASRHVSPGVGSGDSLRDFERRVDAEYSGSCLISVVDGLVLS
jgi:hypothetical protein